MPDPNPECPNADDQTKCRITYTAAIKEPIQEWTPIYDGTGTVVNSDPNIHVQRAYCVTCKIQWDTIVEQEKRSVEITARGE